ncbi:MAG TPA: hypothetical protein VGE50_04825 [Gammaproteobacteria bacterium]
MLSFIYQLARTFELEHGYPPNLLYLNPRHYPALMSALPEEGTHEQLRQRLTMEIILTDEVVHPHVAWTRLALRNAG